MASLTWPQYYMVNSAPYNVGGPIDNAVLQKSIEATYWPTSLIWYQTKAEATSAATAKGGGNSAGVPGTGAVNTALNTGTNAVSTATSWESAIGNFVGTLTQPNLWIRIAKVLVGGVLVIVGIAHMTGIEGAAADLARKVPVPI